MHFSIGVHLVHGTRTHHLRIDTSHGARMHLQYLVKHPVRRTRMFHSRICESPLHLACSDASDLAASSATTKRPVVLGITMDDLGYFSRFANAAFLSTASIPYAVRGYFLTHLRAHAESRLLRCGRLVSRRGRNSSAFLQSF